MEWIRILAFIGFLLLAIDLLDGYPDAGHWMCVQIHGETASQCK